MAYYNLIDYSSCPQVLSGFLHYLSTIKGLSTNTVNAYYVDLRLFLRTMKIIRGLVPSDTPIDEIAITDIDEKFLDSVKVAEIYEYLQFVMDERDNNANSRARKIASLRTYYKYLTTKANLITNNPVKDIDSPNIKKALPKFLLLDESRRLLESVPEGPFYERDFCIITLFLNCGMRLSELVGIDIGRIRDDTVRILGKGNKERTAYLNDACRASVDAWLKRRADFASPKEPNALFIGRTGARLTPRRVEQIVDNALSAAGLAGEGYSAHKLRHTAATLMYRYGGADMLALKEILGHEHVNTTEIYTHISDEQLKKAAASSPLSKIQPRSSNNDKKD